MLRSTSIDRNLRCCSAHIYNFYCSPGHWVEFQTPPTILDFLVLSSKDSELIRALLWWYVSYRMIFKLFSSSHSESNIANTFWRRSRKKVIAETRTASSRFFLMLKQHRLLFLSFKLHSRMILLCKFWKWILGKHSSWTKYVNVCIMC